MDTAAWRRNSTSSRSFVAQYAHLSPTLSLRWPGQAKAGHGISSRMPQIAHFFCMRSSWLGEEKFPLSYRSIPALPRRRTFFVLDATAADGKAAGRWWKDTKAFSGINWLWMKSAGYTDERAITLMRDTTSIGQIDFHGLAQQK